MQRTLNVIETNIPYDAQNAQEVVGMGMPRGLRESAGNHFKIYLPFPESGKSCPGRELQTIQSLCYHRGNYPPHAGVKKKAKNAFSKSVSLSGMSNTLRPHRL